MVKTSRYPATGFMLLSAIKADGLKSQLAAIVNIAKGDALHDDGSGLATNAVDAFAGTFLGIAAADCDNSGNDGLTVQFVPWNTDYRWIVAVGANAVIAQTGIGSKIDLEGVNTVDISDTVGSGTPGFFVDEIDITAAALAINSDGFAIGHFSLQ